MNTFFSILFTLEVIVGIILFLICLGGKDSKVALAIFIVAQYPILIISVVITLIVLIFNFLEK